MSNILHVSRKNDFYIWATKTYLFSKVIPKTRRLEQELLMLFWKCKPVFSFLVLCDEVGVEAFKRRFGFRHFLESMVGVWIWCSISTHSLGFIKYQVKEEKLYNLGKNGPSSFRTNRRDPSSPVCKMLESYEHNYWLTRRPVLSQWFLTTTGIGCCCKRVWREMFITSYHFSGRSVIENRQRE